MVIQKLRFEEQTAMWVSNPFQKKKKSDEHV